ncbi:MAG: hypothetical protein HDR26_00105 [Lachnospiraceae bacterium]|nr:hypothetical protein [Lachnospiraceae bacterium]
MIGGNYQKDIYKQLMEVMEKVDSLESERKQDRREIKSLTNEVTSLRNDNERMKRILNNDSSNSSIPPSKDDDTKPAKEFLVFADMLNRSEITKVEGHGQIRRLSI